MSNNELVTWFIIIQTVLPIQHWFGFLRHTFTILFQIILRKGFGLVWGRQYRSTTAQERIEAMNVMEYIHNNKIYAEGEVMVCGKVCSVGLIIGKWYVAKIEADDQWFNLKLWCNNEFLRGFKRLPYDVVLLTNNSVKETNSPNPTKSHNVKMMSALIKSNPRFDYPAWRLQMQYARKIYESDSRYSKQHDIKQAIMNCANKKRKVNDWEYENAVVLLCGDTGLGKSTIARMIALEKDYLYVREFDPTMPGNWFPELRAQMELVQRGLVLVIEEYDTLVNSIMTGGHISYRGESTRHIRDKTTMNNFFEMLGEIPQLFTILTSNRAPKWFNDQDPSIICSTRIDLVVEMKDVPETKKYR